MSESTTSADPDDLDKFVTRALHLVQEIDRDIRLLCGAYDSFNTSTDYPVKNPDLVEGSLPSLVKELDEMRLYVNLLARALRLADRTGQHGLVTANTSTLLSLSKQMADAQGIDWGDLVTSEDIAFEPTTIEPVPQNSAWVADPVATATGFMVVDVDDLLQGAQRFNHGWRRVHCSGFTDHVGALGPGWWSWADVQLELPGVDEAILQCEDGARLSFVAVDNEWIGPPGVALTRAIDGWRVSWTSRRPDTIWSLGEDGRLLRTTAPRRPDVEYRYVDGRLTRILDGLTHPIEVRWEGGRIVAVSRNTTFVEYGHDDTGHLVTVDRGGVRRWSYTYDETGRVITEIDSDGILRAKSHYDDANRVVEQATGDGRLVSLRFDGAGSTVVTDPWGAETVVGHDLAGRVVSVAGDDGVVFFTREFADDGTVRAVRYGRIETTISPSDDGPETRVSVGGKTIEVFVRDGEGRLVEHRTGDGSVLKFQYRVDGRLLGISAGPGVDWFVDRTVPGRTTVTDPDGVVAAITSDDEGDVLSAGGEPLVALRRDELGRVVGVVESDGPLVSLEYDDGGRITRMADSTGTVTEAAYTPAGRLRSLREPGGALAEYVLDAAGRVAEVRRGEEVLRAIKWYDDDRPLSVTQADGTWGFSYTERGLLSMVTSPAGETWVCEYDDCGRPLVMTAPHGVVLRCEYDGQGRAVVLEEADGGRTLFDWDEGGNLASITDRSGATVLFVHELGRVVREVDADGTETVFEWSLGGRLIASRSVGVKSEWRHDARGRITSRSHGPASWQYRWNDRNRLVGVVDPTGEEVGIEVDRMGRTIAVHRGPATWRMEYDVAGRLVTQTDPSGAVVRVEYDVDGRVVATVDANGGRTVYAYDSVGRPVGVTTPTGASTTVELDAYDRPVAVRDPEGRVHRHVHGRPGGPVARTEHPDGTVQETEVDVLGRPVMVRVDGVPIVAYDLDAVGRIRRIEMPAGRFEAFDHTQAGRVRAWSDGVVDLVWEWPTERQVVLRCGDRVMTETLDEAGLTATVEVDGAQLVVERDTVGRVRGLHTDAWNATLAYAGRELLSTSLPSGVTRGFNLDALGRITRQHDDDSTTTLSYDASGQLVSVAAAGTETTYAYDQMGCLVEERVDGVTRRRYSYDATGWLTRVFEEDGITVVDHDARGRRVREVGPRGERRYEWGPVGLTAIVSGSSRLEVETDVIGRPRRIGDTQFVWEDTASGGRLVMIGDALVVNVGDRAIALSRPGIPLEWLEGSVPGLANGRDAWGRPDQPSGDGPRIGWRNGVEVAGLVWFGARLYDPMTRCFLSPDPVDGQLIHPCSLRTHHYCANDPVNLSDPTGATAVLDTKTLDAMRADATGPQWGNILSDGITLTAFVLAVMVPGAGTVAAAAAFGALSGVGQEVGDAFDAERPIDVSTALINGTIGAATGAAGGKLASKILGPTRQSGSAIARELAGAADGAVLGFSGSVLSDVLNGRSVDWGAAAWSTGFHASLGAGRAAMMGAGPRSSTSRPAVDTVQSVMPVPQPSRILTPGRPLPPGWVVRPSGITVPTPELWRPQLILPSQASALNL